MLPRGSNGSTAMLRSALALALLSAFGVVRADAGDGDPHLIYERRCAACHEPHARDLVQRTLELDGGVARLAGGGEALAAFLSHHPRRGLAKQEADVLSAHMTAMLESGFVYQQKCTSCHERASVLARRELIERDGALLGRYSGRDIAGFLADHGRLTPDEVGVIVAMLRRQLTGR